MASPTDPQVPADDAMTAVAIPVEDDVVASPVDSSASHPPTAAAATVGDDFKIASSSSSSSASTDADIAKPPQAGGSGEAPRQLDPDYVRVPLSRGGFALVLVALMCAVFLPALDQTVVSTILRTMVSDLGDQALISWVGTAYLLTVSVSSLVYGKLADIFGRKLVFVSAVVIFMVGSAVSGASKTMVSMIVGRAVAGLGGGGILSCALIIVADVVSIRQRGIFQGLFGAVFGLSSVIGPLIGGAFSDGGVWRWAFYLNLPVGAVVLAVSIIFLALPAPEGNIMQKLAQVDYLGIFIVLAGVTCFLTPLQLGGSLWAWSSPQVIVMFVLSALLLAAFLYTQNYVSKSPVVPPAVFMNRSVVAFLFVAFGIGGSFLGSVYYIAVYFQVDYGLSATSAGVSTIPLVLGVVFMSIVSGQVASRTGHYAFFPYITGAVATAGLIATSFLGPSSTLAERVIFLLILGLGIGSSIQIRVIGIQASVDIPRIAVATALSTFLQTVGGAFSIAVTGTILNNQFSKAVLDRPALVAILAEPQFDGVSPTDFVTLRTLLGDAGIQALYPDLAPQALTEMIDSFSDAFALAIRFLIVFSGLLLISAFFVKEYGIKGGHSKPASKDKEAAAADVPPVLE
ncbi:hypothetical protein HK405_008837 [Cladochytrium tenue]|nr:hypothetical protein HK405_008837 [Cladochytrium tenue]